MYAKIIVRNNSVQTDNFFTYKIPKVLENEVLVGHRVLVPFGLGNKLVEGFVFEITDSLDGDFKTKEIIDVLDKNPLFTKEDIELIKFIKNRYLCTYIDCINLIYPKGYKVNNYKVVILNKELGEDTLESLNENQKNIIEKLIKNKGKIKIEKLPKKGLNSSLQKLKELDIIKINWEYTSLKNEKKIKVVYLSDIFKDKFSKNNDLDEFLFNEKLSQKQKDIIDYLYINNYFDKENYIEIENLKTKLNITQSPINSLLKKELISVYEIDLFRNVDSNYKIENKEIILNEEQQKVTSKIISEMFNDNKTPYMLYGVTGSGKTEVYIKVIEFALSQGLDSIVLVPEISLTPQTISRFKNKFGDVVGVFHSKLSDGQRHDVYRRVKDGKIRILIGARSALFAPFNNLGVVIIDEFHESSYKSETNPKFSAIEVSKYMVLKKNITLILGSATPSIDEYYKAKNGKYNLLTLKDRANKLELPKIEVVDMKEELNIGNKSIFSNKLKLEIQKVLDEKNQAILFLNRRGYSNFVSCRKCGFVFKCENCDISLTYHKHQDILRCHYCGFEKQNPKKCPECDSIYIKSFGVGTQKVEEELKNIFKDIRVLRVDKDTTSKKGSIENILNEFKNKKSDILIGTQMISKGLDFEDVTLVGILSSDMMLNSPDFKSSENSFQLITQVAGRCGRGKKEGKVILQSYNNNHYVIKRAINYDFENFYNDEIKLRKEFGYLPFNNILSIVISGEDEKLVIKNINKLKDSIIYILKSKNINNFDFMLGPNSCQITKINKNYRYQILFKDDFIEINLLKSIIMYICINKRDLVFDKNINISIDINPNNIL